MSLAFLAKKSWHTTNVKNVEKVWIAEQKAESEAKKLAELQKQLAEERQLQELRKLQAANGYQSKEVDNSLDWMYQGPSAQVQQSTEEYLLGKVYQSKGSPSVKESLQPEVLAMPSSKPSWETKVLSKNDAFSRIHDDPLLLIRQQEKKTRESILSNPLKLAKLRQQIESNISESLLTSNKREKDDSGKRHGKAVKKEHKKEHKKNKKHHKENDRSEKYEPSEGSDDSVHGHSSESRAFDKRNKQSSNNVNRKDSERKTFNRGIQNGKDGYPPYQRDTTDYYRTHDQRNYRRDDDSVESSNEHTSRNSSNRKRQRQESKSRSPESYERYDSSKNEGGASTSQFGLIKGSYNKTVDSGDRQLGPMIDLIKKKEEESRAEIEAKKKQRERSVLTEEEKQRRLKQMEDDAKYSDSLRHKRLEQAQESLKAEESILNQRQPGDVKFLSALRSDVYNSNTSMADRLQRNRHYNQRGSDIESNKFLSK